MGRKKLKYCKITNDKNKDFLIQTISEADRSGNKLIEFMNKYHLIGLKNATPEQLENFILDDLSKGVNNDNLY